MPKRILFWAGSGTVSHKTYRILLPCCWYQDIFSVCISSTHGQPSTIFLNRKVNVCCWNKIRNFKTGQIHCFSWLPCTMKFRHFKIYIYPLFPHRPILWFPREAFYCFIGSLWIFNFIRLYWCICPSSPQTAVFVSEILHSRSVCDLYEMLSNQ